MADINTWPEGLWPKRYDYPQGLLADPTVRSPTADGRPFYRSGDQSNHRTWSFLLRHLTPGQMETLRTFQETVGVGVEPFYWTDVRPYEGAEAGYGSGGTYIVTLAEPMIFEVDDEGEHYQTSVYLVEYCANE